MKNTEKLLSGDCAKIGAYSRDVVRILHETFATADREGVSRKLIAIRWKMKPGKLDALAAPSHPQAISSSELLELACRDDILPDGARRYLVGEIARMAGFTVCDDTDEDGKSYPAQVTEISAAFGVVANRVLAAIDPRSDAGKRVSATENRELMAALDGVATEVQQLKSAVSKGARR
jgi:HAMP domain-containing protein